MSLKKKNNQSIGFDNEKYLIEQIEAILFRLKNSHNKLYLEFGGKLGYDYHASRSLLGYDPNVKLKILQRLKDKVEFILCVYADDIVQGKIMGNFAITYDFAIIKLIDDLREWGLEKVTVVITRFKGEPTVVKFKNKLEKRGIKIYTHYEIRDYPTDVDFVVSKEGFGKNLYIPTEQPIVVVTGPGANSGKMATCLSQLYHDYKAGRKSGYAKFETFPIWNLPLKHMINIAYEASTADIGDYNVIDSFHLDAYGKIAVNYNRDVESFPILKRVLEKIFNNEDKLFYLSPTDMGINRAGFAIVNDEVVVKACRQKLIRYYFRHICEYARGLCDENTVNRIKALLEENGVKIEERKVVAPAREIGKKAFEEGKTFKGIACGVAIQLKNGQIITATNSEVMHAASVVVMKALTVLAGVKTNIQLISYDFLKNSAQAKKEFFNSNSTSLDLNEVLMALVVSANINPLVKLALEKLKELKDCPMHMTHISTAGDERALKKIGIDITCDPHFSSSNLFEF